MLERNVAYLLGNTQQRKRFGGGLYKKRESQIIWRTRDQYKGGYQNRGGQLGPVRDPNVMDVDRERKGDRTCFVYRKQDHMAKNCWQRKKRKGRAAEML